MAVKGEIFKNHEKFKNVAGGFQSYAVIVGILIGGVWARYTFVALKTREKADAELHQFELRKRELERVNREQGVIDIEIKAEQVSALSGPGHSIKIDIKVKNSGNRNVKIEFPITALAVAKVRSDDEGQLHRERIMHPTIPYLNAGNERGSDRSDDRIQQTPPELLRAGQTMSYLSWCRVDSAGLYLIEFKAGLTGEELKLTRMGLGVEDENRPFNAVGQTFLVVK